MNAAARRQPTLLSALRVVTAYLCIWHGTARFFGFPVFADEGVVSLSLYGAAALLDIVGGTLLLTGLFVRPVALLLSARMALAALLAHADGQGEATLLLGVAFLCLLLPATALPARRHIEKTAAAH